MMWPFSKKENRSSFADSISEGDTETPDKRLPSVVPAYVELYPTSADPSKLAIIQTAGNIVYRAFLGADTNIPNNLLPRIARELVLNGEAIAVELDGGLRLIQWPFYDTRGGSSDPNSWAYQLQVSTPRGSKTIYRPGSEIMHFKMNEDALQPWRGQASWKSSTATLLAKIEASLTEQADIPVFQTIRRWGWQSANANTSRSSLVKSALRSRAKILFEFVKSGETPYPSFQVMPEPNAEMVRLRDQLETTLLLQMGIPPSLKNEMVPGATSREAYRQLLHSTLMPMSRLVSNEFKAKTGNDLVIDFSSLYASDLNQRARALATLVKSEIPLEEAKRITGLD